MVVHEKRMLNAEFKLKILFVSFFMFLYRLIDFAHRIKHTQKTKKKIKIKNKKNLLFVEMLNYFKVFALVNRYFMTFR